MTTIRTIRRGFRLALASPRLILVLWLVLVAFALPAGIALRQSIVESVGESRVHEEIRGDLEMSWLGEFHHSGGLLEGSMTPLRLSPLAPLENLEGWAGGALFGAPKGLLAVGVLFGLVWIFLTGGLIERFAGDGAAFRLGVLMEGSARNFPRLLRLAVLSLPFYWAVYRLGRSIFGGIERRTLDVTVEKTVMAWNLGAWALLVLLLIVVNMIFGYAKVATVVDNRRSTLLALVRAVVFVARHPLATLGVQLGLSVVGLAILALYAATAPGPGGATAWAVAGAFLVGQVYLVARLTQRLAHWASRTELYLTLRDRA